MVFLDIPMAYPDIPTAPYWAIICPKVRQPMPTPNKEYQLKANFLHLKELEKY